MKKLLYLFQKYYLLMTGESLKTKAVNSVMWSSIEQFSVQGIQFILSIVIARLVTPSEKPYTET